MSTPASTPGTPTVTAPTVASAAVGAPKPVRRGRPKGITTGSGSTSGRRAAARTETGASAQAKTTAAVVLEGLTGLRSAPESALALGITVARYYTVEAQAVAGLLAACEPAPPGPAPGLATERELTRLRQQHRLQDQELARLRAVLRTTQRSLGVQPTAPTAVNTKPSKPGEKKDRSRRPRRPVVRAMTVVRRLIATSKDAGDKAATAAVAPISTTVTPSATAASVPDGG